MNKLILCITFLSLGFLTVVSNTNPDASAVWLASTNQSFDLLRGGLMVVLLVLMFTNPPRHVLLRAVIGMAAVALIGWSGYMTYQNVMLVLDGFVFLAAGIASLVAVLEFEPGEEQIVSPNLIKAVKS